MRYQFTGQAMMIPDFFCLWGISGYDTNMNSQYALSAHWTGDDDLEFLSLRGASAYGTNYRRGDVDLLHKESGQLTDQGSSVLPNR